MSAIFIILLTCVMAWGGWLEARRQPDSLEVEVKRLRVMFGVLASAVILVAIASFLNSQTLSRLLDMQNKQLQPPQSLRQQQSRR